MTKVALGTALDGTKIFGETVEFTPVSEPWTEYHLEDGTVVKLRPVVTKILRLDTPDPTGAPNYAVQASNVVDITPAPPPSEEV